MMFSTENREWHSYVTFKCTSCLSIDAVQEQSSMMVALHSRMPMNVERDMKQSLGLHFPQKLTGSSICELLLQQTLFCPLQSTGAFLNLCATSSKTVRKIKEVNFLNQLILSSILRQIFIHLQSAKVID